MPPNTRCLDGVVVEGLEQLEEGALLVVLVTVGECERVFLGTLGRGALEADFASMATPLKLVIGDEDATGIRIVVETTATAVALGGLIAKMGATVLIVILRSPGRIFTNSRVRVNMPLVLLTIV